MKTLHIQKDTASSFVANSRRQKQENGFWQRIFDEVFSEIELAQKLYDLERKKQEAVS